MKLHSWLFFLHFCYYFSSAIYIAGHQVSAKVTTPACPSPLNYLLLLSYAKKNLSDACRKHLPSPPDLQFEPRWCLEMLSPLGHFQDDWTLTHTAAAHCMMDLNIPQDGCSWDEVDQSVPLCLRMRFASPSVFQPDCSSRGKRRFFTATSDAASRPSIHSDASQTHLLGPSCSVCQMIHLI